MLPNKKFRSILCLNGELPDRHFFTSDLPIIAVDGAINQLSKMNVQPALIIGDLDSAETMHLAKYPHVHDPDQSTSDFAKALNYLKQHDMLPTIIVGVNGGYVDHVLHNINLFTEADSAFYAPPIIGFVIKAEQSHQLVLDANTKISLMGLPAARITTTGLKWNLDDEILNFPGKNSCFNRVAESEVRLTVHTGLLLVMYYEHPIQDAGGA